MYVSRHMAPGYPRVCEPPFYLFTCRHFGNDLLIPLVMHLTKEVRKPFICMPKANTGDEI